VFKNLLLDAVDYNDPLSIGYRLREKRSEAIKSLIADVYSRKGTVRILDIGGRAAYWNIFGDDYLLAHNVSITLLNHESPASAETLPSVLTYVNGDGCDVRHFSDNWFDIVHSNSTIEHVGDWGNVEKFAMEVRRLAPLYYVQTPYYWFPVEPHFLLPFVHWIPEGLRAKLLLHLGLDVRGRPRTLGEAMRRVQSARLLDREQLAYLFPDARIRFEWFGLLPKSLIAVRGSGR
jgi:hypothetical protein